MLTDDDAAALFVKGEPEPSGRTKITDAQLYHARRHTLARRLAGNLKQWAPGLSVTTGQYVVNDGQVFVATSSGTTGGTRPGGFDGGVHWVAFSLPELLTLPQPIATPA
jgi:hypothetical protein